MHDNLSVDTADFQFHINYKHFKVFLFNGNKNDCYCNNMMKMKG